MDKLIKKKRFTLNRIAVLLIIVLTFSWLIYLVLAATSKQTFTVNSNQITIKKVFTGNFQDAIPIQGTVKPLTSVIITSPEGGNVDELFVEDGILVEKGTPLLKLANSSLLLEFMNRETQVVEQINNLRNLRLNLEETKRGIELQHLEVNYQLNEAKRKFVIDSTLFNQNALTENEYYQSRNNLDYLTKREKQLTESMRRESKNREQQLSRIDASISMMERNLLAIQKNLENLTIKAPITGQLTSFNAKLGESIAKGASLGNINVLDGYKVRALIDEYYLNKVLLNQTATTTIGSKNCTLTVKKIIPEVSGGQFQADLYFNDTIPKLVTRGQTLHLKLALSNQNTALIIPTGGFYQSTGGSYVYVLTKEDIAQKRLVQLGRKNVDFIEIISGLSEGEQVITSSYQTFGNADELIIKP